MRPGGLRGDARNDVRPPSLAGGRALRHPEHPRVHKQHHQLGGPPPTEQPSPTFRQWTYETRAPSTGTDAGQRETTITTAHPSTTTAETDNTSATEKHAKNTHFAPAKVPPVSTSPPHRPAKATPVSTPHGHERAKATRVSTQTADRCATVPPVSLNKHRPDYSEPSCTRHTPSRAAHAKKLVHRAIKRLFRSIFRSLGELFRAQGAAT